VLSDTDDGRMESELVGSTYGSLPASNMPGPGIGFLHNANSVQALAEMFITSLKYSLSVRTWESFEGLPVIPWAPFGSAAATLATDILTITDTSESDNGGFSRPETTSESKGLFLEAVCAVDSYEKGGIVNSPRAVTGVGMVIDDDLEQFVLHFADGGPELGKIAFLATNADVDQNLIDIRAGRGEVAGTYFAVDWSLFHHYRFERIGGGDLLVYLDQSPAPVIQFSFLEFSGISSSSEGVRFGSLLIDRKTTSRWQSVRYSRSYGYDVEALPKADELRYDHAVNVIVEVAS